MIIKYLPAFMFATTMAICSLQAMEEKNLVNPSSNLAEKLRFCEQGSLPSLQEILAGISNQQTAIDERIKRYNPTILINRLTETLKEEKNKENTHNRPSISNILSTFAFAAHFQEYMTSEILIEIEFFLKALQDLFPCKKRSRNAFSGINEMNENQRHLLVKYADRLKQTNIPSGSKGSKKIALQSGEILTAFFKSEETINQINNSIRSFEKDLKTILQTNGQIITFFSDINFLKKNELFLGYAAQFGSPHALSLCYEYGKYYYQLRQFQQAIHYFTLASSHGALNSISALGSAFKENNQLDEALICYKIAAERRNSEALENLGKILIERGECNDGEKYLREAIQQGSTTGMVYLARRLCITNRDEEAKPWLHKLVKQENPEAMRRLGLIDLKEGKKEKGQDLLKRASTLGDWNATAILACYLKDEGKLDEAAVYIGKAHKQDNTSALLTQAGRELLYDLHTLESSIYCIRGQLELALRPLDILLNAQMDNGYILSRYGLILLYLIRFDEAEKYLLKAIEKGDNDALTALGTCLIGKGQLEEAKKWYRIAEEKGDTDAMLCFGNLLIKQGQLDDARGLFLKALSLSDKRALLFLAKISQRLENFQEVEEYLKQAVSLGVQDAEIFYAGFLARCGRQEEALDYQDFHEENIKENEDSSFGEKVSPTGLKDKSQSEEGETHEDDKIDQRVSIDNLPPKADLPKVPSSKALSEEKIINVGIGKKLQRLLERAEKREKNLLLEIANPITKQKRTREKTFKDVEILAHPDACKDIHENHQIKIQGLISSLANGECRGRFEKLKGCNDVYSMRLTKKDRLVFKITGGDINKGVTSLTILSAKGHYEHLESKVTSNTQAAVPVNWAELG